MLTCKELDSFLVDYFDGAPSGAARRRFQWHLWLCPECRTYVDGYEATIALGRTAFSVDESEEPAPAPEPLIEAILDAMKKDRRVTASFRSGVSSRRRARPR